MDAGIYVGEHTLEIDVAPLLSDQMVQAFNDLEPTSTQRTKFANDIAAVAERPPDATQRSASLKRIQRLSKGRYAQRLAEHIVTIDLRARVIELLGLEADASITREDLRRLPGGGAIMCLLDDLRRQSEGLPLLPSDAELMTATAQGQELEDSRQ